MAQRHHPPCAAGGIPETLLTPRPCLGLCSPVPNPSGALSAHPSQAPCGRLSLRWSGAGNLGSRCLPQLPRAAPSQPRPSQAPPVAPGLRAACGSHSAPEQPGMRWGSCAAHCLVACHVGSLGLGAAPGTHHSLGRPFLKPGVGVGARGYVHFEPITPSWAVPGPACDFLFESAGNRDSAGLSAVGGRGLTGSPAHAAPRVGPAKAQQWRALRGVSGLRVSESEGSGTGLNPSLPLLAVCLERLHASDLSVFWKGANNAAGVVMLGKRAVPGPWKAPEMAAQLVGCSLILGCCGVRRWGVTSSGQTLCLAVAGTGLALAQSVPQPGSYPVSTGPSACALPGRPACPRHVPHAPCPSIRGRSGPAAAEPGLRG